MLLLTWTYLSCFMLVLQKRQEERESSMCDPFCKHPAFLANAILTLLMINAKWAPTASMLELGLSPTRKQPKTGNFLSKFPMVINREKLHFTRCFIHQTNSDRLNFHGI